MPAKLSMKLQKHHTVRKSEVLKPNANSQLKIVQPGVHAGLRQSMVARIQNIRPGCGSCGK
jgi:hypothetical protein